MNFWKFQFLKTMNFLNFWLNIAFLALDQIQKLQKMRKKSLWSKNDLYRNKTADINVMQLSMIKFISWQALKMGPKPYYLAPTYFISPIFDYPVIFGYFHGTITGHKITFKAQLVVKTFKLWLVTLIRVLCFQTLIQPSIFHLQILKVMVSWNLFHFFAILKILSSVPAQLGRRVLWRCEERHGQPQAHWVRGGMMGLVTDVDGEINCKDVDVEDQGNHAKDD